MYKKLLKWSQENYSDLPWRHKRSLYTTLVSEIMLQQTTVSTVINHYDKFLKKYPTLKKLAQASEEDVCSAWQGLGYYRRARNLRNAAVEIFEKYNGKFPLEKSKLTSISGIGVYTAAALIAIGADEEALAIDANIERVVSRLYGVKELKGPKLHAKINELFNTEISFKAKKVGYRKFNEALMDLGRTFCQAKKISCELCPCQKGCVSLKNGDPLSLPVVIKKESKKYYDLHLLRIIVKRGSKVLGYVKEEGHWLNGQVELPTFTIHSEDLKNNQYPKLSKKVNTDKMKKIKTSITKYRISNYVMEISMSDFRKLVSNNEFKYFSTGDETHFSSASRKCLNINR